MHRRFGVLLLLLLGSVVSAEEGDQDTRISNLEDENRDLRERLDALELADAERTTSLEQALDEMADEGLGLNMVIRKGNTSATFQIFGDVGFSYSDPARDGRGNAYFFNGSLDLFFTARVGDHFQVLSETVFQTKVGDSESGDSSKFDQERLWGAWAFNDAVQIKFGLEHSPISLWNRLYHHGRWLELTIARPLLTNFESANGILPMHEAGIELLGDVPLAGGSLQYTIFVSNGRGAKPTQVQEFSDQNNDKAVTFGAGYNFDSPNTIFIALFARTDEIAPDSGDPARTSPIREWIGSFQFLFQNDSFSIISEFAYIYQDDKTSGTSFENYTAYFQVGYHISDEWTPYLRIDFRDMDRGDPYFAPTGRDLDWYEIVIGTRFDFLNNAALKFEIGFGEREERSESSAITDESYIRVGVQLAFVF